MYNSISMPEFEQKWKNETIPLIDVREMDEWNNGHVEGAVHLPLSAFPVGTTQLDKNQEYYVMCHSGGRSAIACQQLAQEGYQVVNVMGGISAWKGEVI
ncbi:rhodanese-like domain-containing protein [Carnobacterium sp.]|uniref:rhodanese-like domain-containing protein n=1 Tax=Carnobacterium sp. TaxID=48221 RepID=UPI0028B063D6|nr:rhodanese-like domain-containing protein [Carnobacterium sp.]